MNLFTDKGDYNWRKAVLDLLGNILTAISSISSPGVENITITNAIVLSGVVQTFNNIQGIVVKNTSTNGANVLVNNFPVAPEETYSIQTDTSEEIVSVTVDATAGQATIQVFV